MTVTVGSDLENVQFRLESILIKDGLALVSTRLLQSYEAHSKSMRGAAAISVIVAGRVIQ